MTNTKCSTPTGKTRIVKAPAKQDLAHKKICNLNYLIGITRGNREKMKDLLVVFLEEIPQELNALTAAIQKTNYTLICDILHKIKCSFSILGITSLTSPVDEMKELSAIASGIEKIKQLNSLVNVVFRCAIEEIKIENG